MARLSGAPSHQHYGVQSLAVLLTISLVPDARLGIYGSSLEVRRRLSPLCLVSVCNGVMLGFCWRLDGCGGQDLLGP